MKDFLEQTDVFFNVRSAYEAWHGKQQADTGKAHMCFCVGPQNGQPLCPCAMRSVVIKNGRYTLPERDLGPVKP